MNEVPPEVEAGLRVLARLIRRARVVRAAGGEAAQHPTTKVHGPYVCKSHESVVSADVELPAPGTERRKGKLAGKPTRTGRE